MIGRRMAVAYDVESSKTTLLMSKTNKAAQSLAVTVITQIEKNSDRFKKKGKEKGKVRQIFNYSLSVRHFFAHCE